MKQKRGFTLTEVLLAVMVVGIIGVALASLTTAASREGGIGNSRVLLRNQLSVALRQLRKDVQSAHGVWQVGDWTVLQGMYFSKEAVLVLFRNVMSNDNVEEKEYIVYCFERGSQTTTATGAPVEPAGAAKDGGKIYRRIQNTYTRNWCAGLGSALGDVWLDNVKFINTTTGYPVPRFSTGQLNGGPDANPFLPELRVRLIVELPTNPVVNETVEAVFLLPNGFTP